jgi:cellulose synthase (UDP-forming)
MTLFSTATAQPAPPSGNALLTSLFTPKQKRIYIVLSVFWAASGTWFWVWWFDPAHFVGWVPFLFATIPLLWVQGLQLFFVYVLLQASKTTAPDPVPGQWRVAMIVTKTPSEPFDVLEKTLRAMLDQDYQHDTWLADSGVVPPAWGKGIVAQGDSGLSSKGLAAPHALQGRQPCVFL